MATKLGDITLTKQSGTTLTLNTNSKYVNDDVTFDIGVQSGAAAVTVASTDASIESDSSGRNISGIIGTKSSTAPSSGYYMKVDASGTGSSTVTTAGWLAAGSLGTASATGSFYFPVDEAAATISGTNTVVPAIGIARTNLTLSSVNNGISITVTGGGRAYCSAGATVTQPGYLGSDISSSETIDAPFKSASSVVYVSGATLEAPASGTRTFDITLPNGDNDTITLTFTVNSDGSWSVE